ncbi:MAG: hypothetical protein ABI145_16515 [Steroidobacteraceae bacterium]
MRSRFFKIHAADINVVALVRKQLRRGQLIAFGSGAGMYDRNGGVLRDLIGGLDGQNCWVTK